MNRVLFSQNSDDWCTPLSLYKKFIDFGYFDPCPLRSNFDGLTISWRKRNFVNPPYSDISLWVDKCIIESKNNKEVILLIPARTDTKYFKKLVDYGSKIYFITGRLCFNEKGSAPFPSCLVVLTGKPTRCYWLLKKEVL